MSEGKDDFVAILAEALGDHADPAPQRLERAFRCLATAMEHGVPVFGHVMERTVGGYMVELGELRGFLPQSQLGQRVVRNTPEQTPRILMVLKADQTNGSVVLSEAAFEQDPWDRVTEDFPIGTRVSGTVKELVDQGIFVELAPAVVGLAHVTNATKRSTSDYQIGERVLVEVQTVDPIKRRINLIMLSRQFR